MITELLIISCYVITLLIINYRVGQVLNPNWKSDIQELKKEIENLKEKQDLTESNVNSLLLDQSFQSD